MILLKTSPIKMRRQRLNHIQIKGFEYWEAVFLSKHEVAAERVDKSTRSVQRVAGFLPFKNRCVIFSLLLPGRGFSCQL